MKLLNKTYTTVLLCIIIITSISCKKEQNPETEAYRFSRIITDRDWKMTTMSITPAFTGTENTFFKQQFENCSKDNVFAFWTYSFSVFEGDTKCDTLTQERRDGGWTYYSNAKTLELRLPATATLPAEAYEFTNVELTDNLLTCSMTRTFDSVSYTGNWTFIKQ